MSLLLAREDLYHCNVYGNDTLRLLVFVLSPPPLFHALLVLFVH
jgi:hypothetical protein